jgi:hypothetical protein
MAHLHTPEPHEEPSQDQGATGRTGHQGSVIVAVFRIALALFLIAFNFRGSS